MMTTYITKSGNTWKEHLTVLPVALALVYLAYIFGKAGHIWFAVGCVILAALVA
jgi:hypothetical protein